MRPEQYWIQRGADVIGLDAMRSDCRQADTYRAIADWLIRLGDGDVLDVGCNVAALAVFLRYAGWCGRYVGVDTNPHALKIAKRRETVPPDDKQLSSGVQRGNIRRLKFAARQFQAVVVKDVIEHLESAEPLREAFRVARESVVVATYLPWTDGPSVIERHADGYYTNRYNADDMAALAGDCGFGLVESLVVSETTGWPNQITFWRRIR